MKSVKTLSVNLVLLSRNQNVSVNSNFKLCLLKRQSESVPVIKYLARYVFKLGMLLIINGKLTLFWT